MKVVAALISVSLGLGAVAAYAHSGATGVVKQRMDGMKSMSNATKALGAMKLGAIPFSAETTRLAASALLSAAEAAKTQFGHPPQGGVTEALPIIWDEKQRFDALFDDLIAAAIRLDAVADDPAEVDAAADEVAQTCKDCHERYREKKL